MRIDLNADLGESFGNYTIGADERVIAHISSANIACGFQASDPLVMQKTVELAKKAALVAEKLKKSLIKSGIDVVPLAEVIKK